MKLTMEEKNILADIHKSVGRLEQKIDDVAREGASERAKIYAQATKTNGRVTKVEQWINDYKIRKDERSKIRNEQPVVQKADKVVVEKNVWNDPKLVKAVIYALTAVGGFLIYLSAQGGL